MAECKVPSNLVEGCAIEIFTSDELEPLYQLLQKSFEKIPHDASAMIVIDDRTFIVDNKYMRTIIKCQCKDLINVLTVKYAMLKAGRKIPEFHCLDHSSSEEALKKWISGDRKKDLVISYEFVKGYEHPVIIDTTTFGDVSSRCSSKLITLYPNTFLDMLLIYEKVLKSSDHKCDEVMSLFEHNLENINFNLSHLLGEQ